MQIANAYHRLVEEVEKEEVKVEEKLEIKAEMTEEESRMRRLEAAFAKTGGGGGVAAEGSEEGDTDVSPWCADYRRLVGVWKGEGTTRTVPAVPGDTPPPAGFGKKGRKKVTAVDDG